MYCHLPLQRPQSETQNLYPNLPVVEQQFSATPDKNFRLEKVNEIASTLSQEVTHYRLVGKKYKRANKVVKWLAGGSCYLSAVASSASLGTALSVIGIPAAVPLGALGGCLAIASCGLIITSKKLEAKIKKHQEIVTLAMQNVTLLTAWFLRRLMTIVCLTSSFK